LPIFALANAGVKIPMLSDVSILLSNTLLWGVSLGLLIGKPIGIVSFTWACVRSGLGELPRGVSFLSIWGVGLLAGIGFTMALFIAQLSLTDEVALNFAKIGILFGSACAGLLGAAVLTMVTRRTEV